MNTLFQMCMGKGPKVIESKPMIRKQGNGNFTGFIQNTWSDGTLTEAEFIFNAPDRDAVVSAFNSSRYAMGA